jgi:hypothetical protein
MPADDQRCRAAPGGRTARAYVGALAASPARAGHRVVPPGLVDLVVDPVEGVGVAGCGGDLGLGAAPHDDRGDLEPGGAHTVHRRQRLRESLPDFKPL